MQFRTQPDDRDTLLLIVTGTKKETTPFLCQWPGTPNSVLDIYYATLKMLARLLALRR